MSTGVTIRVVSNPVGTPGFIAPEMFGSVKEVSADKVLHKARLVPVDKCCTP